MPTEFKEIKQTQLDSLIDRVVSLAHSIEVQTDTITSRLNGDYGVEQCKEGVDVGFVSRLSSAVKKLEFITESLGLLLENII